jgi:hypothetical protein
MYVHVCACASSSGFPCDAVAIVAVWLLPLCAAQHSTASALPVDIWSVGCVSADLLGTKPLIQGEDYVEQFQLIPPEPVLGSPSESDVDMSFVSHQRCASGADSDIHAKASSAALPVREDAVG